MSWIPSKLLFERYEVNELGDIRNYKTKKIRKKYLSRRHGRYYISMTYLGKTYNRKVSRVVAEAFVPNPDNLPQVNHIDGDKTNDRASNLEWVTAKENVKHAILNGLINPCRSGKLARIDVQNIRNEITKGDTSLSKIAQNYNVSRMTISKIKRGKIWKTIN